jgi:hypothetical protein
VRHDDELLIVPDVQSPTQGVALEELVGVRDDHGLDVLVRWCDHAWLDRDDTLVTPSREWQPRWAHEPDGRDTPDEKPRAGVESRQYMGERSPEEVHDDEIGREAFEHAKELAARGERGIAELARHHRHRVVREPEDVGSGRTDDVERPAKSGS